MRYLPVLVILLLLVPVMGSMGPDGSRRAGMSQLRWILVAIGIVVAMAAFFALIARRLV
ncbi:MAG: hypothetical protein ABR575_02030 [Actinomycetota bacterium]